jgi:tRNA C32,U32 (ribose-2'-O)-methylase TrmJ
MVKRTSTIQATIKDAQKIVKKPKKPRTSTIDETVATANQGIKPLKKATKTKTMAQTLKDAQASNATPVKQKPAKKSKKVAKKATKKAAPKKSGKSKAQKKK